MALFSSFRVDFLILRLFLSFLISSQPYYQPPESTFFDHFIDVEAEENHANIHLFEFSPPMNNNHRHVYTYREKEPLHVQSLDQKVNLSHHLEDIDQSLGQCIINSSMNNSYWSCDAKFRRVPKSNANAKLTGNNGFKTGNISQQSRLCACLPVPQI